MSTIKTINYTPEEINKLGMSAHTSDWPIVYLLEDGERAYIGESVSAVKRFRQHYKRPERQTLTHAHVFIDDEYNKSATLDTESWLIQYMAADNKFRLLNGNAGLSNHDYFDRERYRAKFEVIWSRLQEMGLASRDLVQLQNSDIFKYSPYKALTSEQIDIVRDIYDDVVSREPSKHIINGDPGTGKSVLASYLIKHLLSSSETEDMNIALVVPMTSLRKTFKSVFSKIDGLNSSMVVGPSDIVGKNYDLLVVDESHRLNRRVNLASYPSFDRANKFYGLGNEGTQLDWILRASTSQVFLYDKNQSVLPRDVRSEAFSALNAKNHYLTSQLRVLGGSDYIKYIEEILDTTLERARTFGEYDLRYFDYAHQLVNKIKEKDEKYGLARVVAGYAWSWKTKDPKSYDYDIELDDIKLKWNSTTSDWVNSPNAINEVGCIHTVQGYDLNYDGVIIGPEVSYNSETNTISVDIKKYKDFNGKRSIESPEELKRYIINIYKTLLTRGIKGTYIHAVDPGLAEYMKSKIAI